MTTGPSNGAAVVEMIGHVTGYLRPSARGSGARAGADR